VGRTPTRGLIRPRRKHEPSNQKQTNTDAL
jgi:hypothetical protein